MKSDSNNLKLQVLANKYMEKTYGKKWKKRMQLSTPAITNAFIDGYRAKEQEDKTADKALINRNLFDKMTLESESIEKVFGLKVIVNNHIPENLIAICDEEMNVLSFIDLNTKG